MVYVTHLPLCQPRVPAKTVLPAGRGTSSIASFRRSRSSAAGAFLALPTRKSWSFRAACVYRGSECRHVCSGASQAGGDRVAGLLVVKGGRLLRPAAAPSAPLTLLRGHDRSGCVEEAWAAATPSGRPVRRRVGRPWRAERRPRGSARRAGSRPGHGHLRRITTWQRPGSLQSNARSRSRPQAARGLR